MLTKGRRIDHRNEPTGRVQPKTLVGWFEHCLLYRNSLNIAYCIATDEILSIDAMRVVVEDDGVVSVHRRFVLFASLV